jgi:hypothetical protein
MTSISIILALAWMTGSNAETLFDDDATIEATLRGPISTLVEHASDRDEYDFNITVGGTAVGLKVRARGNSRLRVCKFPPLRFNFSEGAAEENLFAGQDVLKVITHCNDKSKDAGNVYNEYLAYRIFNLLSDNSYRVRLFRITYVDTDGHQLFDTPQHAFVLESNEALAARIGATPARIPAVAYSRLDDVQATLVYVFQYLIGNTDWSLVTADSDEFCCHNGDLFERDEKLVMVPYDFDLAGLVNASYARPDSSLRLKSVKSRRYRGYCTAPERVRIALETVKQQRAKIIELTTSIPAVSDRDLAARKNYLIDFFEQSENEEQLLKLFERRCL